MDRCRENRLSSNVKKASIFNSSAFSDGDPTGKIFALSGEYDENFAEHVDPEQIESKYGGTINAISEFWPPQQTNFKTALVSRNIAKKRGLSFFQLNSKDVFKSTHSNLTSDKFNLSSAQFDEDFDISSRKSSFSSRPNYQSNFLISKLTPKKARQAQTPRRDCYSLP